MNDAPKVVQVNWSSAVHVMLLQTFWFQDQIGPSQHFSKRIWASSYLGLQYWNMPAASQLHLAQLIWLSVFYTKTFEARNTFGRVQINVNLAWRPLKIVSVLTSCKLAGFQSKNRAVFTKKYKWLHRLFQVLVRWWNTNQEVQLE